MYNTRALSHNTKLSSLDKVYPKYNLIICPKNYNNLLKTYNKQLWYFNLNNLKLDALQCTF